MTGFALELVTSYLNNRKQYASADDKQFICWNFNALKRLFYKSARTITLLNIHK